MHSVSIVGCGYTGLRLARRWLELNWSVRGFGSRDESLSNIAAIGADAQLLNLDGSPVPVDVGGQLVYYTVPPGPTAPDDGGQPQDPRINHLLRQAIGKPRRIIYLSTTGVYGNRGGELVDEETEPAPQSERSLRRLASENTLRRWADSHAISWCILRVPAIYGPGRLPLARLRRRDPTIAPIEAKPSNRIHVDDLVTACVAAGCATRADRRIYNVTDGSDDSPTAYLQRVARIGNLPQPPFVSLAEAQESFSPMAWSFLSESRRVDNRRMLDELGIALAFADLDAGIRASL